MLRPDTYGDLILTIPLLRTIRERLPDAQTSLLIRAQFADIAPLMPEGVRVILTRIDPYAGILPPDSHALKTLGAALAELQPDWVITPCFNGTWLERWVASRTKSARRISVTGKALDPLTLLSAETAGHPAWDDRVLFPEQVKVEKDGLDLAKTDAVLRHLFGDDSDGGPPRIKLTDSQRSGARQILSENSLVPGQFLTCCPAGIANVKIKAWPVEKFAACIARAEQELALPTLVLGHEREIDLLQEAVARAQALGAKPRLWLGTDGSFVQFVSLLESARAYIGNDTGGMHAAAAAGVPTVGVFGGGHWPRFAPIGSAPTRAVVQPLGCFGCDWKCIFGNAPCVQTIPEASVYDALSDVLSATEPGLKLKIVDSGDGLNEQARALMQQAASERAHEVAPDSEMEFARRFMATEKDRAARFEIIQEQGAKLGEIQAELNVRRTELDELRTHFTASEADRAARLDVILQQGQRITALESELSGAQEELQTHLHRLRQLEREHSDVIKSFVRLAVNLRTMVRNHTDRVIKRLSGGPDSGK